MRKIESSKFLIPLVAVVALGTSACTGNVQGDDLVPSWSGPSVEPILCADPQPLEAVRAIGSSKSGGYNVVNDGSCVPVYDMGDTTQTIGSIETDEGMDVLCQTNKPNRVLVIGSAGVTGWANYSNRLLDSSFADELKQLAACV